MSIEQELNRAKFHERKGEFIEAKNIYLNILKAFPKNLRVKKRLEKLNITKQTNSSLESVISSANSSNSNLETSSSLEEMILRELRKKP